MPKGKKDNKKGGKKGSGRSANGSSVIGSDEDTFSDITSVSGMSDVRSVRDFSDDDTVASVGESEDTLVNEDVHIEDKMKDDIENMSDKSLARRMYALNDFLNCARKVIVPDFLMARKATISEALLRIIKKGKGEEQAAACQVVAVLILQIATEEEDESIATLWQQLKTIMQLVLQDDHASPKARAACASTLGIGTFVVGTTEELYGVMNSLESCFKESYLKGDDKAPTHVAEIALIHAKALHAWNLLITRLPTNIVFHFFETHLATIPGILESNHVALRIAAGESIALLYELARLQEETFEGEQFTEICEALKELSTDSSKYRSKNDRRQQRACFREILRSVELYEPPSFSVRFGTEALAMDSWAEKITYEEICNNLGIGMNGHLQKNELLRDIFSLGAPLLEAEAKANVLSKFERKQANAENFKIRSIHRGRNRDKRTAVF